MRVQCHLSEDEIKIAISKWLATLGKEIKPMDVIITHCTTNQSDTYGASFSYEDNAILKRP